jgi:hypothetical protein
MKKTNLKNISLAATAACLLALPAAHAADWNGNGDGFSWEDGANWGGGNQPTLGTLARFNTGSSDVYITQAGEVADRFIIGQGGTIHKLTIESGGSLTTDSGTDHRIGQTSEGWIIMNGGTLNVQNGGYSSDAGGRLIINDGDVDFGGNSSVGNTSAGFLEINGSTATIDVAGAYTFGSFSTTIFTLDSALAGVSAVNNTGDLNLDALSTLTVDFRGYDFSANKGSDIVLFDYGTLGGGGADTFGTINFIGGFGELDYTTGGQIRLLSVVPEPSSTALLGLGLSSLLLRRKRS